MKTPLYFFLSMIFMTPALLHAGDTNPWERKLPFKNATIEYALSGVEKGTETLHIRDYGAERVTFHKTVTNMMGMTMSSETVEFTDPDWVYTYDLRKKKGTKTVNPQKYMIEEYNKLSKAEKKQVLKNSEDFGSGMAKDMGGRVERKAAKILGYECDKVTVMGATVYSIHDTDIALKTESNMMGMTIKIEATRVDTGAVADEVFIHPKGITPVVDNEADAMSRSMARQTMEMLKDPDAAKKQSGARPVYQSPEQQDMTPEEQEEMQKAMEALKGIFGN